MEYSSKADTLEHKMMVTKIMNKFVKELLDRSVLHDQAKLEKPELDLFDVYTPKLAGCTYGSDEYKNFLKELQPALEHHYKKYRHHPEFGIKNSLIEEEIWVNIKGYNGFYQISNYGRVKSLYKNDIIKPNLTPKGYFRIQLSCNGIKKNVFIHTLVAENFLPEQKLDKNQVNHKNGIKTDNFYLNLEWVNNSENQIHAYDSGLQKYKHIIYCEELDIITFGSGNMVRKLKDLGYDNVRDSGILACIYEDTETHLGLHFVGYEIEHEYIEKSACSWMNTIDVIEMLVDWKAATLRHNDGNILKSLEHNRNRFGLDKVTLYDILMNSLNLLEDHNV